MLLCLELFLNRWGALFRTTAWGPNADLLKVSRQREARWIGHCPDEIVTVALFPTLRKFSFVTARTLLGLARTRDLQPGINAGESNFEGGKNRRARAFFGQWRSDVFAVENNRRDVVLPRSFQLRRLPERRRSPMHCLRPGIGHKGKHSPPDRALPPTPTSSNRNPGRRTWTATRRQLDVVRAIDFPVPPAPNGEISWTAQVVPGGFPRSDRSRGLTEITT